MVVCVDGCGIIDMCGRVHAKTDHSVYLLYLETVTVFQLLS